MSDELQSLRSTATRPYRAPGMSVMQTLSVAPGAVFGPSPPRVIETVPKTVTIPAVALLDENGAAYYDDAGNLWTS